MSEGRKANEASPHEEIGKAETPFPRKESPLPDAPEAGKEATARNAPTSREEIEKWKAVVAEYQKPNVWRASWQLLNTLGSYAAVWCLIYLALPISWWLTIPLVILAGGLLVRTFIIFHDCGHGSYFKSRRANDFWGFICGLLTFTPYYQWRWEHARHHATAGNLDERGVGDIWTLTVQEYLESSRWKRFAYRLSRNPFILFVLGPLYFFLVRQRLPSPDAKPRERRSVHMMNAAILAMACAMSAVFGIFPYLLLQIGILTVAGAGGIWLFYVQHQFEDAYWERSETWDYTSAALQGSSYYKLPRILQWFSGNIGFHHIHHLSPRIPNYNLERCHRSHPMFQEVKPITLLSGLKTLTLHLWDETSKKLVGFRHVEKRNAKAAPSASKEEKDRAAKAKPSSPTPKRAQSAKAEEPLSEEKESGGRFPSGRDLGG